MSGTKSQAPRPRGIVVTVTSSEALSSSLLSRLTGPRGKKRRPGGMHIVAPRA